LPPQLPLPIQGGQTTFESESSTTPTKGNPQAGKTVDEEVDEDHVAENDGIGVGRLLLNDLAVPPNDLPHIIDGVSAKAPTV